MIKEHAEGGGDRAIWVSTSKDLAYDAERDLEDVEADVEVHPKVRHMHACLFPHSLHA